MTKKRTMILIVLIALVVVTLPAIKSIAESMQKEIAYQFVVDGKKWFTVSDKAALESLLDEYKNHYLDSVDASIHVKSITFRQRTELLEVEVMPEEIDSVELAKEMIYAKEKEDVVIEVKPGDNLWNLARDYDLTVSDLEALNPEIDPEKIFPGDKLVVSPFDPVLDVVIELENTVVEAIPFQTEYKNNSSLYKSQRKTIKKGLEGEKEVTYKIVLVNGYQNSLEVVAEKVLKEPVAAIVEVGTKTTVSRGGSVNYGVVSGKRISSTYGSRIHPLTKKRTYHDGIDIAANYGNGVYAYADGKVVQAGWNGGYGNSILIDHGNSLQTRYAHLSKISVNVGQKVTTGQRIGSVGSSGVSTGPHLHFEVLKNGKTTNPLNYI